MKSPHWSEPAPEVYYLLHRWRETGRLRLLDLGCGVGRHSLFFARGGFHVTASDVSADGLAAVTRAAREGKLSLEVVRADARHLPFPAQAFDAVLAFHSIYHVHRDGMLRALAELRRVLAPSGEAFVTFISKTAPSFSDPESVVVDDTVRLKREEEGSVLPHFYVDASDLFTLLQGFNILSLRQVEDVHQGGSGWHYFVHLAVQGG